MNDEKPTGLIARHSNPDAEKSLVATAMQNAAVIDEVGEIIDSESFGSFTNSELWRAMLAVKDSGMVVDAVSVAEFLGDEKFKEVGGARYVESIWQMATSLPAAKANARIIRRHAISRKVIQTAQEIIADADSKTMKPEELLESVEKRIFAVTQDRSTGTVVSNSVVIDEALELLERRVEMNRTGKSTGAMAYGLRDLDKMTAGMHNGELIVVGARPGVGKTILGCHLADIAACQKSTAFFVSLEQARYELELRLLSKHSRVDSFKIRQGELTDSHVDQITSAAARIRHSPLWWDDTPAQTVRRIASQARRLKSKHDLKILVIDYMQLIESANRRQKRHEQVGEITRALKLLARELAIPVVVMAQLNRESETQGREPRLSDLREAGSIEQDADTVILIHPAEPPKEDSPTNILKLLIRKQRNGPLCDVQVIHDKKHYELCNFGGSAIS